MKSIKFIFFLLVIISCNQEKNIPNAPITQATFFDLEDFFQNEINQLSSSSSSISKRIKLNKKDETQKLSQVDFAEELKIFQQSNINKLSWIESYEVDSIFADNQLTELHYQTENEKLKTKSLSVFYAQGKVSEIQILNKVNTALADSEQKLHYKVGKGYTIENLQEVSFTDPQTLFIEVYFY